MYQKLKFLNKEVKAVDTGKFAVFDLGSNGLRLVIFDDIERYPHQFISERFGAHLAEGKDNIGPFVLSDKKIEDTMRVLKWFDWICKEQKVKTAVVVATSAIRDAVNGQDLVNRAKQELAIDINVIDGVTEAKLSAIGALNSIKNANGLVLDLGGGSLEIYCTKTKKQVSLPLGVLTLQSLTDNNPAKAEEILTKELQKYSWIVNNKGEDIIANGGGMRSIAVLHMNKNNYQIRVPQGYQVNKNLLIDFFDDLILLDPISSYLTGYDEKFKSAIPYRAVLLKVLFNLNDNFQKLKFSNFGLREGVLFSQIETADYNLAEKYAKDISIEKGFGLEYALSSYSFVSDTFKNLDHDVLYLTALLKDIAWRVHKQYRGKVLFDEILNLDVVGIDHKLRVKLALAAYFTQERELSQRLKDIITDIVDKVDILHCKLIGQAYKLTELLNPARDGDFSESNMFVNANNEVDLHTSRHIREIINPGLNKRLFEINLLLKKIKNKE